MRDGTRKMMEEIAKMVEAPLYEFDLKSFPSEDRVNISYLSNASYVKRKERGSSIYAVTSYGRNCMARNKLIAPQNKVKLLPRRPGYPIFDVMVGGN